MSQTATQRSAEPWALLASKGVLVLWFVYLLVGPTVGFGWIDSWHNEQRAVQVVLLCATAIAFSLLIVTGPGAQILATRGAVLVGAFLGLGLMSAAVAERQFAGFAEVSLFALLFALAAMPAVIASWDRQHAIRRANHAALFVATAYVLGVLVRLAAAVDLGKGVDLNVLILGFANPRFPSALHTVLIPFVAAVAIQKGEPPLLRIGALAVLTLIWAINWGLGTRGIWFAYLIVVPAMIALLGWRSSMRLAVVLIGSAAAGVTVFLLLQASLTGPGIESVAAPTQNVTLTSREVLWMLSWKAISSAPLLGVGPMNFAAYESYVGAHPHNWLLQSASEWGLISTVVLLVAFARLALATRSNCLAGDNIGPITALLASLTLGLVDGNLVMPVSQSAVFLVLGLSVALTTSEAHEPLTRLKPVGATAILAVLCASLILVQYSSVTLAAQRKETVYFQHLHPSAWLVPRFWEQGLLLRSD